MKQAILSMVMTTAVMVFAGSALADHGMHADHVNRNDLRYNAFDLMKMGLSPVRTLTTA